MLLSGLVGCPGCQGPPLDTGFCGECGAAVDPPTICGVVSRSCAGVGPAGATVELWTVTSGYCSFCDTGTGTPVWDGQLVATSVSDAEGVFAFDPPGGIYIIVVEPDAPCGTCQAIEVEDGMCTEIHLGLDSGSRCE